MKRITTLAALSLAALALSGCGKSDKASDAATADNVEMPAEEALATATGQPSADPSALATDAADASSSAADAAGSAADSAMEAASGAASQASTSTKNAVDAAQKAAEKKL